MKEKIKLQINMKSKSHVYQLITASLFTTLISIGTFFIIPIKPVSITMQSLFVLLAGVFLTPSYLTLSISAYILLGLAGLSVFAEKAGGLEVLFVTCEINRYLLAQIDLFAENFLKKAHFRPSLF